MNVTKTLLNKIQNCVVDNTKFFCGKCIRLFCMLGKGIFVVGNTGCFEW